MKYLLISAIVLFSCTVSAQRASDRITMLDIWCLKSNCPNPKLHDTAPDRFGLRDIQDKKWQQKRSELLSRFNKDTTGIQHVSDSVSKVLKKHQSEYETSLKEYEKSLRKYSESIRQRDSLMGAIKVNDSLFLVGDTALKYWNKHHKNKRKIQ